MPQIAATPAAPKLNSSQLPEGSNDKFCRQLKKQIKKQKARTDRLAKLQSGRLESGKAFIDANSDYIALLLLHRDKGCKDDLPGGMPAPRPQTVKITNSVLVRSQQKQNHAAYLPSTLPAQTFTFSPVTPQSAVIGALEQVNRLTPDDSKASSSSSGGGFFLPKLPSLSPASGLWASPVPGALPLPSMLPLAVP